MTHKTTFASVNAAGEKPEDAAAFRRMRRYGEYAALDLAAMLQKKGRMCILSGADGKSAELTKSASIEPYAICGMEEIIHRRALHCRRVRRVAWRRLGLHNPPMLQEHERNVANSV